MIDGAKLVFYFVLHVESLHKCCKFAQKHSPFFRLVYRKSPKRKAKFKDCSLNIFETYCVFLGFRSKEV